MKTRKTVVEVMRPVIKDNQQVFDEEGKPLFEPRLYYLLHWGLEYGLSNSVNPPTYINYTVAICQDVETGIISTFLPGELKVVGVESK